MAELRWAEEGGVRGGRGSRQPSKLAAVGSEELTDVCGDPAGEAPSRVGQLITLYVKKKFSDTPRLPRGTFGIKFLIRPFH